jgi:hypothetical protein
MIFSTPQQTSLPCTAVSISATAATCSFMIKVIGTKEQNAIGA